MGFRITIDEFNQRLLERREGMRLLAPTVVPGTGRFSNTDVLRYAEIADLRQAELDRKSEFSAKEILLPISQVLFQFSGKTWTEPEEDNRLTVALLRSCDIHSLRRFDEIYLRNGPADSRYRRRRDKLVVGLIGCPHSFDNCFCASLGTNTTQDYDFYLKRDGESVVLDPRTPQATSLFGFAAATPAEAVPEFAAENKIKLTLPQVPGPAAFDLPFWQEYDSRCIACGRCTFVCPTCTCFTMQDVFYRDNPDTGERRRVWASCHVDGFTEMAGGHSFRKKNGERMRFKVLHKIYDYPKRFGYPMCTGCGRCDDACPEYISYANAIIKLGQALAAKPEGQA